MAEHSFTTTVRVLYGDTDAAGVVYNANYLRYFEKGRTELMREWICTYSDIEKMGFILPVTECWARYKAPAKYDDLLTIETSISELSKYKCKFAYRIVREDRENNRTQLLVKGYTVHVATTTDGKLTRLPEVIISQMAQFAAKPEKMNSKAK
ncbi:acyl-CoA thioesterase [Desulforhopalus singaporensis]|uniref:Acyl-CoA thioester hydrolase n=1 Tax=Desulforhopalus singaporensis TaxID=91360 RepID=A0A1H0K446_9BACT|nr:thioesterase family protein [Desulforhopalus singaporensis]SDO50785.1 acyl-CoA thioester hydrolase [Desulforhopalus singaporensis]